MLAACMQGGRQTTFSCTLSCVELYNENATDLLAPARGPLELREDPGCAGVFVDGLSERQILNGAPRKPACMHDMLEGCSEVAIHAA